MRLWRLVLDTYLRWWGWRNAILGLSTITRENPSARAERRSSKSMVRKLESLREYIRSYNNNHISLLVPQCCTSGTLRCKSYEIRFPMLQANTKEFPFGTNVFQTLVAATSILLRLLRHQHIIYSSPSGLSSASALKRAKRAALKYTGGIQVHVWGLNLLRATACITSQRI